MERREGRGDNRPDFRGRGGRGRVALRWRQARRLRHATHRRAETGPQLEYRRVDRVWTIRRPRVQRRSRSRAWARRIDLRCRDQNQARREAAAALAAVISTGRVLKSEKPAARLNWEK